MRNLAALTLAAFLFACGSSNDATPTDGNGSSAHTPTSSPTSCETVPSGRVQLPADESPHLEPTEWWYWTGHLQTADGRWFGFEWAFFSQELLGVRGQMVHHAITDQSASVFAHDVRFLPFPPAPVEQGFDLEVGVHTAVGFEGEERLSGEAGDYRLDLELSATKPPVFHHGSGYIDYEFGGYTYYYSRPRMAALGTLTVNGEEFEVSGTAWFDHQWGELARAIDTGWDWFAIQLDDDREIMLFIVRADPGEALAGGTYTNSACESVEIEPEEFEVTALGEWTSPHTGCTYPVGWTVSVLDLELTVTPVMEDQEVDAQVVTYWEGMAEVGGDASGRAYVELSGYCD